MDTLQARGALPPSLRAALESGAIVVTPNKRLARRVAALHDHAQRAAGCSVWNAPTVIPWSGWLERLWLDVIATDSGGEPPRLHAPAATACLWATIVASDAMPLIDERGAAALAADAWALVHAWGTGAPSWRAWAGGGDDCAVLARWADTYAAILARDNALDSAQLPDWLARRAAGVPSWRGTTVALAGFVEIAPQQERLLAALSAAGMRIALHSTVPDTDGGAHARRAAGATPRDEIVLALQWARERALADPHASVGIAIEDFASRREEVRALAEDILCPALQWPGREGAARPYNLSLGAAASDVPLMAAALGLIALAHAPLPVAQAAALLRSPYVAASPDESLWWAQREADWLREGRRDITLDDAIGAVAAAQPSLASRWRAARAGLRIPARASPREWTDAWRGWLAAAGWPGQGSLSSAEWQARGAWDELLARFATLGSVASQMARGEAVATLAALARSDVFQPETVAAPIQISGLLEAAGVPLDALWVAGLAAERWPPAPQPNALLPIAWQRERNVPRSTAARELAYAQALTAQWARGAREVVFSFARSADDHPRSMSSIVPAAPWLPERETTASTSQTQFQSAPAPDSIADERAPPLAAETAAGGAGLIEAQGDCPFRATALFRLGADAWPTPIEGLSAKERGSLVHAALAAFWRDVADHAALVALSPAGLQARVDVAAAAAVAALPRARWRRLPAVVRDGEAIRIATIVRAWLDGIERTRPPFAVAEMEASRALVLGGLRLRLRLDRVDALSDGGVAIVDYKTGAAKPPAKWFDPRPQAPQLGLYVLAQRAAAPALPVRAAAYAQLKPGEVRLQGIAADAGAWPGLDAPGDVRRAGLADWTAVEAFWAQSLGALADEIRDGHAAVAPRDGSTTCRHCGLQPLCRVGALAIDGGAEAGDE